MIANILFMMLGFILGIVTLATLFASKNDKWSE